MEIRLYNTIPEEAKKIRTKVFIEEQGFAEEYDETDLTAAHLVAFESGEPMATCRYFWDVEKQEYVLGRLAVLAPYRGKHVGAALIGEAEVQVQKLGGQALYLHAQCRAGNFYEKQGYQKTGAQDLVEGCPHTWMYKEWGPQGE